MLIRYITAILFLCFIVCGCPTTLEPYYCDSSGYGFRFENEFGKESECDRSFMGSDFRGYGTITNHNEYDAYIEIERQFYRHSSLVKSFTVEANNQTSVLFTGGDAFRIKKTTGEPVGIVRANILYKRNGREEVYIGEK